MALGDAEPSLRWAALCAMTTRAAGDGGDGDGALLLLTEVVMLWRIRIRSLHN